MAMNRRTFIQNAALFGAAAAAANVVGTAFAEPPAEGADFAGEFPEGMDFGDFPGGDFPGGGGTSGISAGSMDKTDVSYVPGVGEYPVGVPAGTPEGLEWLAIPEAITDIRAEYTADVVIVGAGIAGLSAARAACEEGASVIVVEACDTWQTRGQDCGTINSSYQKEMGLECTEEDINQVCLEMQKYTGNRANQAIMRTWAARSGADYDWWFELLEPEGYSIEIPRWPLEVGYDPVDGEWFPQFCNQQEFVAPEGQGDAQNGGFPGAIDLLAQASVDAGAQYFFNTRARQLVRGQDNATGRVTAVIAEDADGNYVQFNAEKGIVLATGDYGHNNDMMSVWCPAQADLAATSNVYSTTANQGDGLLMGMWVGGKVQAIPHPHMAHGTPGDLGATPHLLVDINGRRFTNEDIPGQTFSNTAELQPRHVWWQIADAQYPNQLKWSQPGHGATLSYTGDIDAWNAAIETGDRDTIEAMLESQGNRMSYVWTIEELAEAIYVDPAVLTETIERYNELCEAGYDADFGKQAKRLFPVSTPPYFYSTSSWSFLVVMGGLLTDAEAHALDQFGNPIPGLYVCGNAQGGRFAIDYPTIVCGISHSMCLTYGRIAGTNAANEDTSITEYVSIYKDAKIAEAEEEAEAAAEALVTTYNDGVYEAAYNGLGGKVPVTVTIDGGVIVSVEIGSNSETQGIGSNAIDQLPDLIVAANGTAGVSVVAGATLTSNAIINGVNDCLEQAGA